MFVRNIFIAGVSSGIGRVLAEEHIRQGDYVYAVGRSEPKSLLSHPNLSFFPMDLSDADLVRDDLSDFVNKRNFDRAILSAGSYSDMHNMIDFTLERMRETMNINVWAHKHIIDALMAHTHTQQVVAFGASPATFVRKGLGDYAISKAALTTMIQLYAEEFPHVHFSTIAPVLIQTPTLSALLQSANSSRYPVIQEIRDSLILPLGQAIPKLMDALEEVKRIKSGSFVEMKKLGKGHY